MFDTSKLRGRIIEKCGSQKEFAQRVGCSISFLSQYLNGKKILDQRMIDKWSAVLEIDDSDIPAYFFARKVHAMEQRA